MLKYRSAEEIKGELLGILVVTDGKGDCSEAENGEVDVAATMVVSIAPILLVDRLVASISVVDGCVPILLSNPPSDVPKLLGDDANKVTPEVPLCTKDVIADGSCVFVEVSVQVLENGPEAVKFGIPVERRKVGCDGEVVRIGEEVPDRTI